MIFQSQQVIIPRVVDELRRFFQSSPQVKDTAGNYDYTWHIEQDKSKLQIIEAYSDVERKYPTIVVGAANPQSQEVGFGQFAKYLLDEDGITIGEEYCGQIDHTVTLQIFTTSLQDRAYIVDLLCTALVRPLRLMLHSKMIIVKPPFFKVTIQPPRSMGSGSAEWSIYECLVTFVATTYWTQELDLSWLPDIAEIRASSVPPSTIGDIEGTVKDISAAPIVGVIISIVGGTGRTTTDASGHYLLRSLPIGDTRIRAEKSGFNPQEADVTVEPEMSITQDFTLTAA